MKLYRIRFGVDNGYSGFGYHYVGTQKEAKELCANDGEELGHDKSYTELKCEVVDVPTDKKGLIRYLNNVHSQAEV